MQTYNQFTTKQGTNCNISAVYMVAFHCHFLGLQQIWSQIFGDITGESVTGEDISHSFPSSSQNRAEQPALLTMLRKCSNLSCMVHHFT